MTRTTGRLCEKVRWLKMDNNVEKLMSHMSAGRTSKKTPETVLNTTLSDGPWIDMAVDLAEIPDINLMLVLVDYYYQWPEVILVTKTDATHVITYIEAVFRTHGLPFKIIESNPTNNLIFVKS